jgi:hypothetical protein
MKNIILKLLGVPKTVIDFIWPLLSRQVSSSLSRILPLALSIVQELMKDKHSSGAQKRQKAIKMLNSAVKKEGLDIASSVLNLAIEMAVANLKFSNEDNG